jgi:PAS domain S-box-containing protein
MAEQATDIIHHVAPDGRLIFLSPSVEAILGWPPEHFVPLSDVGNDIHPRDLPRLIAGYRELISSDEMMRLEYRFRHKSGHFVWLETTMRAVRDQKSALKEIVGITRDMSERKRHEIELMAARERAEAASQTKSRFLANMSHELRTPLNAIIGFSDMLKLEMFGTLGNPRYVEYAQLINESGGLLLDLISDILDMSKIEAGKYILNRESLDIHSVVEAAVKLVRGRAEESGLTLHVDIAPEAKDQPLFADPRALKQILLNLLSNAMKFTPAGGDIAVAVAPRHGGICLQVRDSGRGIPEDQIPRLGHAFEQITTDVDLAKQGTGLGLALVRSLAELHGGSMVIESEVGHGTSVSIILPIGTSAASRASAAQ